MQVGNSYGSTVIDYQYQNRYNKSANPDQMNPMENQPQDTEGVDTDWSANAIFASGIATGQHFAIYKAEDYDPTNPIFTVKGTDSEGNAYEQNIDPRKVDGENCNYVEFMALNAYLVDMGKLEASDVNAFSRPTEDDLETADYMKSLRQWRDTQFEIGNMVGYQHAAKNVDAVKNFEKEQDGTTKYIQFNGQSVKAYEMEGRLKSGILGLTAFPMGKTTMNVDARYGAESTVADPVIEVHLNADDGSSSQIVKVHINDIDPENATELEMFALCSYADSQGMSGTDASQNSYMELLQYVSSYGGYGGVDNLNEFMEQKQDWVAMVQTGEEEEIKQMGGGEYQSSPIADMLQSLLKQFVKEIQEELEDGLQDETEEDKSSRNKTDTDKVETSTDTDTNSNISETTGSENIESAEKKKRGIATVRPLEDTLEPEVETVRGQSLTDHVNGKSKVPYSYLAQNGIVEYNGVTFVCDEEHSALCLGDMSNDKDVLTIPMSNGGVLKVNRDNLGDLGQAIGMFSPEDVRRILEAIAQDNKSQQTLQEIEEDKNKIGDGNTNTANGEPVRSQDEAEQEAKADTSTVLNNKSPFEHIDEIERKAQEQETKEREIKEQEAKAQEIEVTEEMLDQLLKEHDPKGMTMTA